MIAEEQQVSKGILKTFAIAIAMGGATLMSSLVANAQQNSASQVRVSGWFKACNERDGSNTCNVQFRVQGPGGVNIVTLSLIEIEGENERRAFQIFVPTGRSLPPGIQIQVDGKRSAVVPYLHCRPQGCTAEVPLDDKLVEVFKKGGRVDVTTISFQGQQQAVPVTLKGFTAAYDGPPVERNAQRQRELSLQEELQRKAEEKRQQEESGSAD